MNGLKMCIIMIQNDLKVKKETICLTYSILHNLWFLFHFPLPEM